MIPSPTQHTQHQHQPKMNFRVNRRIRGMPRFKNEEGRHLFHFLFLYKCLHSFSLDVLTVSFSLLIAIADLLVMVVVLVFLGKMNECV
uniref:Transmembrane protein n=1 Tax=Caenorhabditis tropicalis TaxID=1561998 RepID=A0A1I7TBW3_9PELO